MVDTIEVSIRVNGPASLATITLAGGVGKLRVRSRVRTVRLGLSRDSLEGVPLSAVLWYVGQAFLAAAKGSRGAELPTAKEPPPAPPEGGHGGEQLKGQLPLF